MLFQKNIRPFYRKKRFIQLNGQLLLIDQPIVMGIINCTPDSFFEGSRYLAAKEILGRAGQILEQGGKIIDVGAISTRPGALPVTEEQELSRLLPALKAIKSHFPQAILSVDTYRSEVVRRVADAIGGFIINDISGGNLDPKMFETVASLGLPYILSHIQGTPATMQQNPVYQDVLKEVMLDLSEKVNSLKLLGVNDIIIDPGFGFGKTAAHNFELLNKLDAFRIFELPLLVGISRKTMIWKTLETTPEKSLNGTTVLHTLALMADADILRVHDVNEAVEAIRLVSKIKQ